MVVNSLTKGLQDGVGLQDLLFYPSGHAAGDGTQILKDEPGGFRLSGAALAADDDALVGVPFAGLVGLQGSVRCLRQSEDVGLQVP